MERCVSIGQTDPARLSGEALKQWYLRSPEEIEQERRDRANRQSIQFFGWRDPDPSFALDAPEQDPDPAFSRRGPTWNADPGFIIEIGDPLPQMEDPDRKRVAALPKAEGTWEFDERSPSNGAAGSRFTLRPSAPNIPTTPAPATFAPHPDAGFREVPKPTVRSVAQQAAPSQPERRAAAIGSNRQLAATSVLGPSAAPRPSFFSYLFGGPAPMTSPQGNVVGYYDHDAGKVGLQITAAYAGIAPIFQSGGWLDAVGTKAASPVIQAIDNGIVEALQRHHPVPRHMGGRWLQELAPLRTSLHTELHDMLRMAFKEAGFPSVGGKQGSRDVWLRYFETNPDSYGEALKILQRVTRDFDKAKGTNVTYYLDRELAKMAARTQRRAP